MQSLKSLMHFLFTISGCLLFVSCDKKGDFLSFSIEDDKTLGEMVTSQIAEDPSFKILPRKQYPVSYTYLENMFTDILNAKEITYREEFDWKINIIDGTDINAFATPGGQIYLYTGLIFFLDMEDDLAGVIGHEIVHADRRHGSKQLQRQYGISALLSITAGRDTGTLQQIVGQIAGTGTILPFSRNAETEADDFSVRYLSQSNYACNGASFFFRKLLNRNARGNKPKFLISHPGSQNRAEAINGIATELGCNTSVDNASAIKYQTFRNTL